MANINKRKSYTVKEKLGVIERVKSGVSKAQIKRELGIPEGTIRGWIAEEGKLRSFLDKLDNTLGLERKKSRLSKNETVDECLYTWFIQKRGIDFPLSGPILKMQAEKFFKDLKIEGKFSATDGWLWRWQKRHGIGEIKISGEAKSSDKEGCETRNMSSANLQFFGSLTKTDPYVHPVVIIGQVKNLTKIKFNDIKVKLSPRVTEEVYATALASLHPSPTDTCSMYLNLATLAALPVKCSRHNAPSHAHAITKIVKSTTVGSEESVVIVCERRDVLASACAVARAYPLFSRKTSSNALPNSDTMVRVEFLLVPSSDCQEDGESNGSVEENLTLSPDDLLCLESACTGVRLAARICDAPCSEMNVDHFVKEVKIIADLLGLPSTLIRGEDLRLKGFGGIYGVGKAAVVPPALAVLSHTPEGATQTIAWVGKGIVYDTGGLSIKAKTAMPGMKHDCGGAAAILGAFYAAVQRGFTQNLHAVFCLAENSVGPKATRPDDIHVLYSGKTVEINNTDAEGRLVLADGVSYAQKYLKANIIIDMATLTGAQGVSTGKYHGAILTNSEQWEEAAVLASRLSGDLVFPIPYCPELHFSEFASAVADMKNSVADRHNAASSCAGLFIASHLGFDFQGIWLHVDMAFPVHSGERATGYGVALLITLFGDYSQNQLLQSLGPKLKHDGSEIENPCKKFKRI